MEVMILKRGAESVIILDEWEGFQVVVKRRNPRSYRHPELDKRLRKERMRREARLLRQARASGVPTPHVLDVRDSDLVLEWLPFPTLKEVLGEHRDWACRELGRLVARLHLARIVHGDLTTSNMLTDGKRIYLLDFGLARVSESAEDRGVDLHLIEEALKSAHPGMEDCFREVLEGYREEFPEPGPVLEKLEEIRLRGRYVER